MARLYVNYSAVKIDGVNDQLVKMGSIRDCITFLILNCSIGFSTAESKWRIEYDSEYEDIELMKFRNILGSL